MLTQHLIVQNTPHGWREVLVDIADPKAVM